MLNDQELNAWCERLKFSEPARDLVAKIRSSDPVRRVASANRNVSGQYPSSKMGLIVQFESHRNELPAIYDLDDDREVLEYYDQPSQIKLNYQTGNGRKGGHLHTPDFFVIRNDSAGWEECKEEARLSELARTKPNQYVLGENGQWRCPPGEHFAARFNFYYRIRSSKDIDWIRVRNRVFLQDYILAGSCSIGDEARRSIVNIVTAEPGITLDDLFHKSVGTASRDDIYASIANNAVYIDLSAESLTEPNRVKVFPDKETATGLANLHDSRHALPRGTKTVQVAFGTTLNWDAKIWTIVNVGETKVSLTGEGDSFSELPLDAFNELVWNGGITAVGSESSTQEPEEVTKRVKAATPEDFAEANRRYTIVRASMRGEKIDSIPKRTLSHYVSLYRHAEAVYGSGFVGLLPRTRERGNRNRKLPEESLSLLRTFIENDYESLKQKRMSASYAALLRACEQSNVIVVPSYRTFTREIEKRPLYEQTLKRKGKRAAYQHDQFYSTLKLTTPRHGDRPFEICHIDHTKLDVELVHSSTGEPLGRPWATIMSDAFSRRFLAVYLTFDPPSNQSCMMALRECVRRLGRFPETLVVDGGSEFASVYFETLLARYECTKKTRPPAKARFGSVCERLFGTANTQFIHTLLGNTQITRNVRQVTKSVNPKGQAVWTLRDLYACLCQYAYEVYDTNRHPALGQSPREAFKDGIERTGTRLYRRIEFNEEFLILTLPSTPKGTAKVLRQGVKIKNIYYSSDAFRDLENTQVAVRYDPIDVGVAFAFVKNRWVQCFSEHYATLRGRSQREMQIAREELLRGKTRHNQQFTSTARKMADFFESVESNERLLGQRLRDRESREVIDAVNGGLLSNNGIPGSNSIRPVDDDATVLDAAPDSSDDSNEGTITEIYEAL